MTFQPTIELLIEGELRLRQFTAPEAADLFALIDSNRDHLAPYIPFVDDCSNEETVLDHIFFDTEDDELQFGIWDKRTLVGGIELIHIDTGEAEITSYYLGEEFQGRGYMRKTVNRVIDYVFRERGCTRVMAFVDEKNTRSVNVLGGSGFVHDTVVDGLMKYVKHKEQ